MSPSKAHPHATSRIVMIGTFPPPMHGMAVVNAAVREQLVMGDTDVVVLDVAAPSLHRGVFARLGRLPRVLRGLARLATLRHAREHVVYMSLSGGFGQVYDLAFVLLARLRGLRMFFHHHSFAYLDRRSRVTAALVLAAGTDATHVTLSPGMADRLRENYRGVGNVTSVSNAVLLIPDGDRAPQPRTALRTIGYLSNICVAKGIHHFLDVCEAARDRGLPVVARLAGPFQDAEIEASVRARLRHLPAVTYLGPVYGADKAGFYAGIDVLLFPTIYANEAEPVTLHEAMSQAVPVIAYGRGAIPEILAADCGQVVPPGEDFTAPAIDRIARWVADPARFAAASAAAYRRFVQVRAEDSSHWQALKDELMGERISVPAVGPAATSAGRGGGMSQ